jgi:hypothetical protein
VNSLTQPLKECLDCRIWSGIINLVLLAATIGGLVLKFLISRNLHLNSDMVLSGLLSYEFWNNNYLLKDFYLPLVNPYYFTDIYPFHVFIQFFSHFDPGALKLTAFFMFCLVIVVYGYLIFKLTHNATNTFIFSALVANMTPLAYYYYEVPTQHVGTILFIGLLLLVLFNFPDMKNVSYILAFILIVATVFSDYIVLVWFVIPGLFYYAYIYYFREMRKCNFEGFCLKRVVIEGITTKALWFIGISIAGISGAVLIGKCIPYLQVVSPPRMISWNIIQTNFTLFIKYLILFYNEVLFTITTPNSGLDFMKYLTLIVSLGFLFYLAGILRTKLGERTFIFLILSGISSLIFFVIPVTALPFSGRYISFLGILIFFGIALCYNRGDKIFLLILFSLLLLNGYANVTYAEQSNAYPNQEEHELIRFLESEGLINGVGDFWDANTITYLSGQRVMVLPVALNNNVIVPFRWMTSEYWYEGENAWNLTFILVKNETAVTKPDINRDSIQAYLALNPPEETMFYGNYAIYRYDYGEIMQGTD